jgi:hypothetical protein
MQRRPRMRRRSVWPEDWGDRRSSEPLGTRAPGRLQ